MGVQVDEAGGDMQPGSVDHLGAVRGGYVADLGNDAATDADIGLVARLAGAVENHAAPDDGIEFGHGVSSVVLRASALLQK